MLKAAQKLAWFLSYWQRLALYPVKAGSDAMAGKARGEAYHSAGKVVWIDAKYWTPLRDEIKDGEVRVYMREDVNGLIVKRGMGITIACIAASEISDSLIEQLNDLCRMVRKESIAEDPA